MNDTVESLTAEYLSLADELIPMLLDEKGGCFRQLPGWRLNCAVVGGALAELSFRSRLDSGLTSLYVVDPAETGDPVLAARGQNPPGIPMKQARSAPRVSVPRGGRTRPWEIRTATHPRWPLSFTRPRCKVYITLCNVCYTFYHSGAALRVAPRTNSAAIPPPSRLAGPAPRRSRCSGGFVHGLLDPILKETADEPGQHNARYWIERLAPRAESIVDLTPERWVEREILQHHEGEFRTPAPSVMHGQRYGMFEEGATDQFMPAPTRP